jgi:hypothetical protein
MRTLEIISTCCIVAALSGCVHVNWNDHPLIQTALWGGFFKNVSFVKNGGPVRNFPTTNASIWMKMGFHGEPPSNGWNNSFFFGGWDSSNGNRYEFIYAYNDSFPGIGQTQICSLETVASSKGTVNKDSLFLYKNIDISYVDSVTWLTIEVNAPDTKLTLTGIEFDSQTPLTASDNHEVVDTKNIKKTHAVKFKLTWSNDTLQGEFHWADITVMRPPPGLGF